MESPIGEAGERNREVGGGLIIPQDNYIRI